MFHRHSKEPPTTKQAEYLYCKYYYRQRCFRQRLGCTCVMIGDVCYLKPKEGSSALACRFSRQGLDRETLPPSHEPQRPPPRQLQVYINNPPPRLFFERFSSQLPPPRHHPAESVGSQPASRTPSLVVQKWGMALPADQKPARPFSSEAGRSRSSRWPIHSPLIRPSLLTGTLSSTFRPRMTLRAVRPRRFFFHSLS